MNGLWYQDKSFGWVVFTVGYRVDAYETIFVIKSGLTDDEATKIVEKVREMIPRSEGEVLALENWGRRKMAYEVRKEKKGTYAIVHYKGGGVTVGAVERFLRLDEAVLKYITVKIGEDQIGKTSQIIEEKFSYRGKEGARFSAPAAAAS